MSARTSSMALARQCSRGSKNKNRMYLPFMAQCSNSIITDISVFVQSTEGHGKDRGTASPERGRVTMNGMDENDFMCPIGGEIMTQTRFSHRPS